MIKILCWEVEADPVATRSVHDMLAVGGADECNCRDCFNYTAVRDRLFPVEALRLFDQLGIRADRECEVTCVNLGNGRVLYQGWFHFVGKLISGPVPRTLVAAGEGDGSVGKYEVHSIQHEPLTPQFSISLIAKRDLASPAFANLPLVQLEFTTEAPWVLAEPPEVAT